MSQKIKEYATSFTIHGLSKVYTGNKLEKCIWLTFVLAALIVSGFIIKIFATKYQRHDVYQSHSSTFTARLYYPQVTFCLLNLSPRYRPPKYFSICDTGIRKNQSCNKYKGPFAWSNRVFIIKQFLGSTANFGTIRINPNDIINHEETNGSCITWHAKKTIFQDGLKRSTVRLTLYVPKNISPRSLNVISVTVVEQNVSGIFQEPQITMKEGEKHIVTLSKTVTIRKPKPFPSNCTYKTKEHKFPGLYSQTVCHYFNHEISMYQRNITTKSFGRYYIPKDILNQPSLEQQSCPLACESTRFDISSMIDDSDKRYCNIALGDDNPWPKCIQRNKNKITTSFSQFSLSIQYQHPQIYTTIEEKELYSFSEMLAEIGGFIGLLIGASCMSVLELIIYAILLVLKRLQ